MKKHKIAVILSGCGHLDGSEIHEATMSLWAIHSHGCDYHCFAPDIDQLHVINHLNGEETGESRNVLVESARIARGKISDLNQFKAEDYDALIIPGGFGAAKNLSDYFSAGVNCQVNPEVKKAIIDMHQAKKPIGALCIAPMLLARLISGVEITLGQDPISHQNAEKMGASTQTTDHGQIVIDRKNLVVSTPCYMLDARVDQIGAGADALMTEIVEMME
ncbi:isoprenoid biosynthesis glyoxalase ElbB [Desulfotalea psychrophila]|uniref:DJ-1/PfpI domain-containing protein n=1 Tax=Desulfotalea psychrophila (strain LSv54 / DSM 12343) TaxID=177439 RepID=Q6APY5_DESPS|nr:isoprenoid biosynthesis glyoxalase ElbB [Desulfotalea psychrophila]CAG35588.1 conserved hypothetical protein [Desulfotalea psychrophila LSv54]